MGAHKYGLQVIENDALVVLCLNGPTDVMTHHQFKLRAQALGFDLTRSQCHNMLNRALGRVNYSGAPAWEWRISTAGMEYRQHVVETLRHILGNVGAVSVWHPT